MSLIDTHAHIFVDDFKDEIDDIVSRARVAGVKKILLPNIDESTIDALKSCSLKYPEIFLPMMGLHPTSVNNDWKNQLELIYKELSNGDYIAVGERGIDLH